MTLPPVVPRVATPPPPITHFSFTGVLDQTGATRIAAALNSAVNAGAPEIYLSISSPGGYVADGIFLYNHIRALPVVLTMHNTGSISSIAVAVFLAAEHRFCSTHSMFMIHPSAFNSTEGFTATRLQATLTAALADDQRTENILRERCAIPEDLLVGRRTADIHITPEQALAFRLVQEVREFALPRGQKLIQI